MWGADCITDNPTRWGYDPFKIRKAVVRCAEMGPTSGRQEGTEGTEDLLWAESRAAQLLGEEGKGEVRPERLPLRQVEQQQEWGDLSGRPNLRGAKCQLFPAWVGGVNSELQGILGHSEDP